MRPLARSCRSGVVALVGRLVWLSLVIAASRPLVTGARAQRSPGRHAVEASWVRDVRPPRARRGHPSTPPPAPGGRRRSPGAQENPIRPSVVIQGSATIRTSEERSHGVVVNGFVASGARPAGDFADRLGTGHGAGNRPREADTRRMAVADESHVWSREDLARITDPRREEMMPRGPVIEAVAPRPGDVVVDVGAGLGWLTIPLAERVGRQGTVYAVEPSPDGSAALAEEAARMGWTQIQVENAFAEAMPLPAAVADAVLWHTVALVMGNRAAALAETFRVLKPGGRFVVVDWTLSSTDFGPPRERRVHSESLRVEAERVGFRVSHAFVPGPVTWGLVFTK